MDLNGDTFLKHFHECIRNDSFRQTLLNFTMMKICILIYSISNELRIELIRREIEVGSTLEVAKIINYLSWHALSPPS